jgi:Probable Zinc-ribbon domain/ROS/MUCR transcriptional regulator protein
VRLAALGSLADGTLYFAPVGQVPYDPDEDRVQCHLCGEWFRVVGGLHLRRKHGWTISQYRDAFGLLKGEPTCSRGVSEKLRQYTSARIAAGELMPPVPYRKPPGSGGRGVRRSRSLGAARPDLVAELCADLNDGLDVFSIGVRSGQQVWWQCPDCGHKWRAPPHGRSRGEGCPHCGQQRRNEANRRVARERTLAVKRPDLVAELHPSRNPDLDLGSLALWSKQKVWWRCRECGNEWMTNPGSRARAPAALRADGGGTPPRLATPMAA